jgi:hypothetical protein
MPPDPLLVYTTRIVPSAGVVSEPPQVNVNDEVVGTVTTRTFAFQPAVVLPEMVT